MDRCSKLNLIFIFRSGSQEASSDVMEQLRQQRTLLQSLSSQRDEVVAKDTLASL